MLSGLDFSKSTPLCNVMSKYGSDKSCFQTKYQWHNYTIFYYNILKDLIDKPLRVFELGLGTNNTNVQSNMGKDGIPGASLRGWAEFFPNASVFGADIDRDVLFEETRIKTYYCDQTNPSTIHQMWTESDLVEPFDLIVEDGLHTYEANVCFFENSIHRLKEGGIFIIEDVKADDIPRFEKKIADWKQIHPLLTFETIRLPYERNGYDNNIIYIH